MFIIKTAGAVWLAYWISQKTGYSFTLVGLGLVALVAIHHFWGKMTWLHGTPAPAGARTAATGGGSSIGTILAKVGIVVAEMVITTFVMGVSNNFVTHKVVEFGYKPWLWPSIMSSNTNPEVAFWSTVALIWWISSFFLVVGTTMVHTTYPRVAKVMIATWIICFMAVCTPHFLSSFFPHDRHGKVTYPAVDKALTEAKKEGGAIHVVLLPIAHNVAGVSRKEYYESGLLSVAPHLWTELKGHGPGSYATRNNPPAPPAPPPTTPASPGTTVIVTATVPPVVQYQSGTGVATKTAPLHVLLDPPHVGVESYGTPVTLENEGDPSISVSDCKGSTIQDLRSMTPGMYKVTPCGTQDTATFTYKH
jgi:hypothetical protein